MGDHNDPLKRLKGASRAIQAAARIKKQLPRQGQKEFQALLKAAQEHIDANRTQERDAIEISDPNSTVDILPEPESTTTSNTFTALSPEKMREIYTTLSQEEQTTHISAQDLRKIIDLAHDTNIAMFFRPINLDSLLYIKNAEVEHSNPSAQVIGKTMFVHGKSSVYGPTAGLIPFDAGLSKAFKDGDADKITQGNNYNRHALATSVALLKSINERYKEKGPLSTEGSALQQLAKAGIPEEELDQLATTVQLKIKLGAQEQQLLFFKNTEGLPLISQPGQPIYAVTTGKNGYIFLDSNQAPITDQTTIDAINNLITTKQYKPTEVTVMAVPTLKIENGEIKIDTAKPIVADIDPLAYGIKPFVPALGWKTASTPQPPDTASATPPPSDDTSGQSMTLTGSSNPIDEYDIEKIYGHTQALIQAKETALKEQSEKLTTLTDDEKKQLLETPINELLTNANFTGLKNKIPKETLTLLKTIEVSREPLRGMGVGTDESIVLTALTRSLFPNKQVSHGPENYNIYFPQPLDRSWIVVDPRSKQSSTVNSEADLIAKFNEFRKDGYGMLPNPSWGWQLNEAGDLCLNQSLRDIDTNLQQIKPAQSGFPTKDDILEIQKKRLKLGILYIIKKTPPPKEEIQQLQTDIEAFVQINNSQPRISLDTAPTAPPPAATPLPTAAPSPPSAATPPSAAKPPPATPRRLPPLPIIRGKPTLTELLSAQNKDLKKTLPNPAPMPFRSLAPPPTAASTPPPLTRPTTTLPPAQKPPTAARQPTTLPLLTRPPIEALRTITATIQALGTASITLPATPSATLTPPPPITGPPSAPPPPLKMSPPKPKTPRTPRGMDSPVLPIRSPPHLTPRGHR